MISLQEELLHHKLCVCLQSLIYVLEEEIVVREGAVRRFHKVLQVLHQDLPPRLLIRHLRRRLGGAGQGVRGPPAG